MVSLSIGPCLTVFKQQAQISGSPLNPPLQRGARGNLAGFLFNENIEKYHQVRANLDVALARI